MYKPESLLKKIVQFFLLLLIAKNSISQEPCNDDALMNIKGTWEKTSESYTRGTYAAQAIIRLDKIQQLLQAAYPEPKGIEAGVSKPAGMVDFRWAGCDTMSIKCLLTCVGES